MISSIFPIDSMPNCSSIAGAAAKRVTNDNNNIIYSIKITSKELYEL